MDNRTRNGLSRLYDKISTEINVDKETFLAEFEKCEIIYSKETSTGWETLLYGVTPNGDGFVRISENDGKVKLESYEHADDVEE